ncbi:helix-turn-helix transcriptional regulator [Kitasatospora sp. NPDC088351]|uniref:helix-turn-helix domain-containing protein n=1 Tax=Kitasatospora sp. NPDC088351 TaxID=3155180 RepID=UPI0034388FE9
MVNRKQLDPSSSHWAPFGVQLRRSREAAGLTQAELARKVGYDPSYVSYTELASREAPSEQFARKVDEVLNTGGTLVLMWFQHKHTALLALSRADSLAMIRAVREEPSPCPALT